MGGCLAKFLLCLLTSTAVKKCLKINWQVWIQTATNWVQWWPRGLEGYATARKVWSLNHSSAKSIFGHGNLNEFWESPLPLSKRWNAQIVPASLSLWMRCRLWRPPGSYSYREADLERQLCEANLSNYEKRTNLQWIRNLDAEKM